MEQVKKLLGAAVDISRSVKRNGDDPRYEDIYFQIRDVLVDFFWIVCIGI